MPDFLYALKKRISMADKALIDLLIKCVATPSVNPVHTRNVDEANEFRMAEVLAGELQSRGFVIEMDETDPLRPNVIGRFGPSEPRYTLLFESHLDTVGVANMTIPPFDPAVRDGRLYGRGACDTKGPMAAALHAMTAERLHRLAEAGVQLLFVGAMGEEHGNIGAEQLVARGIGADASIILEPTDQHIVFAHKGVLWIEVILTGAAAHASTPQHGRSAISAMANLIAVLEKNHAEDVRRLSHPDLGAPTQNVGMISGGEAVNIVAHQCRIELDRRILPGQSPQDIVGMIESEIETLQRAGAILGGTARIIKSGLPFITARDSALVTRLSRSIQSVGETPVLNTAGWFSDAGPFAQTCQEIVVFGPGSIKQAHTVDEFIELDELQKGADIMGSFLEQVARDMNEEGER